MTLLKGEVLISKAFYRCTLVDCVTSVCDLLSLKITFKWEYVVKIFTTYYFYLSGALSKISTSMSKYFAIFTNVL